MTCEQFTYWLQGYFEISGTTYLSELQTQIVKDHLDLVFKKVTPDREYIDEIYENIRKNKEKTYC